MAGDDFEKQAAAMAAPPPAKFVMGARSIIYTFILFLIFCLSVTEFGLWSWQLQTLGNLKHIENYPSGYILRTGNLLFFDGIYTMLVAMGAFTLPLFFQAFLWFASAVMFATGSGIFTVEVPFSASNHTTTLANWVAQQPHAKIWVAEYAVGWTLFALTLIMFAACVVDPLAAKQKRHYLLGQ